MKKRIDHWTWFIIVLLSLIPLLALAKPGMFVAHDSVAHVVRLASFYQSLTEGNIFPRWAQTLNAGYGHPIFMFLYPLPSYAAAAFHFLGFSFINSIKLVLAVSYVMAGIFMYLWLKKHFTSQAALVGSAVFQLAPYRFVNLYVRNAFGENTAYLFMPLSLLTFYLLIKKPTAIKAGIAALSLAGLILAHNAVSLMFLPFLIFYVLLLLVQKVKRKLLLTTYYSLFAGLLAFGLSAFFWFPAFTEGKYTLRDIVMHGDSFADHFPTFSQLIVPHWGYGNSYTGPDDDLSLQIGLIQWLAFLTGAGVLLRKRSKIPRLSKYLGLLALVTFAGTAFLMLQTSLPVWQLISVIKKFQFPWRLLIMPVFASGLLAAFAAEHLKYKSVTGLVILGLLIQNHRYWQPQGAILPPEEQVISQYLGTTDTGESTPLWAVRFQEKRADDILGVVHGAPIEYEIHKREAEVHEHTITATVRTQVSENTLYFPGWTVYVDGHKTGIIFTDPNWRGVITYPVPAGTHSVRVVFEETKLRQFANIITFASAGIVMLTLISARKRKYV